MFSYNSNNFYKNNDKNALVTISLLSVLIISFLIWLIYFKVGAAPEGGTWIDKLPAVNAILNLLTASFLIIGYILIKKNNINWHKKLMLAATLTSGFFLIGYISYHHFHGDTKFVATGMIRPLYFGILISHILLSVAQVPLIFSTLYFAFSQQFTKHKKSAKITFPIWLYVSITGVVIFIILKFFNN